jgi:hypothetical protein
MPTTKHRRKGKIRPRGNIKTLVFPRLTFEEDPETLHEDQLIQERLCQMHGQREWNDDEWEEATEQLVAEGKVRPYEELEQAGSG